MNYISFLTPSRLLRNIFSFILLFSLLFSNFGWVQASGTVSVMQVATNRGLPDFMFVSLKDGSGNWLPPRYSWDAGRSWTIVPSVPWSATITGFDIAVAPKNPANHSAEQNVRLIMMVSFSSENTMYYRSGDLGETWSSQDYGDWSGSIVASVADPGRLYMGLLGFSCGGFPYECYYPSSVLTSANSGVDWEPINSETDNPLLTAIPSPVLAGRVYVHRLYNPAWWFVSEDGGKNWVAHDYPVGSLVLDAQQANWIYSLGKYSLDGGATWQTSPTPPCDATLLLAHPTKSRVLFAECKNNGLYRSVDGGQHWTSLVAGESFYLVADESTPGRLLWLKDNELWASIDDGLTWSLLNPEATLRQFLSILNN